jgi:hypothetical protein
MMAATSFCQTSTESQESLPGPAIVGDGCVVVEFSMVECGWDRQRLVLQWSGVCWSAGQCKWSRKGQQEKCGASMWALCEGCELTLNLVQTARLPTMHASDDHSESGQHTR